MLDYFLDYFSISFNFDAFFALDFRQKIGRLRRYFLFLAPACTLHLILRGKSESVDVKTFFALHLTFGVG